MSIPENLIRDAELALETLKLGAGRRTGDAEAHMASAARWLEQTAAEIRKHIEISKP